MLLLIRKLVLERFLIIHCLSYELKNPVYFCLLSRTTLGRSCSYLQKNIWNYSHLTYQNWPTDDYSLFIKSGKTSANCTLWHIATGCFDWLKSYKKIIITLNICPIQLGLCHWFLLLLISDLGLETIFIIFFVIRIKKSNLFLSLIKAYFVALALSYRRISQIIHLSPIKLTNWFSFCIY